MNLEEQLKQEFGKTRPFKVPEGYFEQFASDLINQLPESKAEMVKMNPVRRTIPWLAAACFIGVILFSGAYSYFGNDSLSLPSNSHLSQSVVSARTDVFEQTADYMMIDSDDMYAYLADY